MHSIALIGCGDVAEQGHLPAILQDQRFKLTAACDLNRSRAELLSSRGGGLRAYTDWRDLLASEPQLDAVVLALPPEVSPDIAIESLSRALRFSMRSRWRPRCTTANAYDRLSRSTAASTRWDSYFAMASGSKLFAAMSRDWAARCKSASRSTTNGSTPPIRCT